MIDWNCEKCAQYVMKSKLGPEIYSFVNETTKNAETLSVDDGMTYGFFHH